MTINYENNKSWLKQHVDRLLIARIYEQTLKSPPPELWNGAGGTASKIFKMVPGLSRKKIKKVIHDTYEGIKKNQNTQACVKNVLTRVRT